MEKIKPDESAQLLKQKYNLHISPEVDSAASRKEVRTGEKVSHDPLLRIENYLDRLDALVYPQPLNSKKKFIRKERNLNLLTKSLYSNYIIKPEKISDDYLKNIIIGNEAEVLGYEMVQLQDPEIKKLVLDSLQRKIYSPLDKFVVPIEVRKKFEDIIITDQKTRMKQWVDYLTSDEARHTPSSLRYWAFREVVRMGDYDPERTEYNKRTETTVSNFPELDPQALSLVFDEIRRQYRKESSLLVIEDKGNREKLKKLLQNKNFSNLYAFMQEHIRLLKLPSERLAETMGEWRTFSQGSDPKAITESLSGFQTKWCITGEGTAKSYLTDNEISIYYSQDANGKNTLPRACIVYNREFQKITEVRGIIFNSDARQHLDDYIVPVVEKKLGSIDGGKEWADTMKDMNRLSEIHKKHLQHELLDRDDLIFLYQIDREILSFGYGTDPRVKELIDQRIPEVDMPIIFDCDLSQIAHTLTKIETDTKAYIGPILPGIFDKFQEYNIEHIYTSFPEGKIKRVSVEIGGKTKETLCLELEQAGVKFTNWSSLMIESLDNSPIEDVQILNLVRLKVSDLGFSSNPTIDQLYRKAQELGLDLCPAEAGAQIRLQYIDQPMGDDFFIGMEPIDYKDVRQSIFWIQKDITGLCLDDASIESNSKLDLLAEFVFRLRTL